MKQKNHLDNLKVIVPSLYLKFPISDKLPNILAGGLFLINAFNFAFRLGAIQLGGDEVASYVSLMPFLHALLDGRLLPTFLVFFHEPIFQLIQLPMTIFGASQVFVRFPSFIIGLIYFIVLYRLGRLIFGRKNLYVLSLLLLYMVSAYIRVLGAELNHGLFNLILATSVYYIIKFDQRKKFPDLVTSYKLLLVDFFVYIDAIFLGIGFVAFMLLTMVKKSKIFSRDLVIPTLVAISIFTAWSIGVYGGSLVSGTYQWQQQAPFSLLIRGTSYSFSAIVDNINLFRGNTSIEYLTFLLIFLVASIFDKRSRPIWALLIPPLIYFNLVKMPTVHLYNFLTLILVGAVIGMRSVMEHFPKLEYFIILFLCIALVKNIALLGFSSPFGADRDYKIAATFLRKITPLCDKVFIKTSLDGYAFRFYFNRGYETAINNQTLVGLVDGTSSYLETNGFGKIAQVSRRDGGVLSIYRRGYKGIVMMPEYVDSKLFNFSNTITYISECYYNKK